MHSCAVLVVSSDGYQDLWQPFFRLFKQYWPDCPFPVFLGTQTAAADIPDVQILHAHETDLSWGSSLRSFLQQIDCEHVLIMLEDFFLLESVATDQILAHLSTLRKLGGRVLRLSPNAPPTIRLKTQPGIAEYHRLAPFRVSLQASIWNKQALLGLLKDGESPWQFELDGTLRSQRHARGFFCTRQAAIRYRHVVERGEWFWSAAQHYGDQKIGCDFSKRPVMGPVKAARKIVVKKLRRLRGHILSLPLHSRELDPYAPFPQTDLRVAFLTNLIPPYQKPVLQLLTRRHRAARFFLSTSMETNRPWKADWEGLDVVVQRTYTTKGVWRHPRGFTEELAVHVPLDTLQQLRRFEPDVVISAEMGARTLLAILFRKLNPSTRLIIWAEAAESTESGRGALRQFARKLFVKQADAFLAVGSSTVTYLSAMGAPPDKIFKVDYSTDLTHFATTPLHRRPQCAHRLLFCGQFIERKGLLPFLKVLSQWAADHPTRTVEFALAGDGPLREPLSQLPLSPNVKLEFLGVFQYDDLPAVYAAAGVFVLPTLADTWAVVVNEALAAGLPVLGSVYAQAVKELIQDGSTGWTFAPDNAQATYQAIDRMMNTSGIDLAVMRERARATGSRFTPERVADLIQAAVNSCVDH